MRVRRKTEKEKEEIFGEGKEIFAEEKDGERKAGKYFMRRSKKLRRKRRKIFAKGK